jgi:hypothetical protein
VPRCASRYGLRPARLAQRLQHNNKEIAEPGQHLHLSTADPTKVGFHPWLNIQSAQWLKFGSARTAKSLFDTGHDRVVIVWDILPRWEKPDGEAQDLLDLRPSLVNAGVDTHPCLYKVAIHKELEAWLLADGAALSTVLSRPAHPVTIKDSKNAETEGNAKKKLEKLFELHNVPFGPQPSQGSYQPKLAAVRIAEKVPANFGQLGKLKSFKKFGRALTVVC